MSKNMDLFKIGEDYKGFKVVNVFELKDYHSTAIHLLHKKTGLEVLHLYNDETENLFSFSFRTPNPKGNGAAHIMEHSVLCGSEKYPLKDPFTQLSNQSVKTYLNAATYGDKTCFPASSIVEADYFNLMSVYGDAVFFPLLSPEIFLQEAHRVEINEEGNPSIQGVVYNEMKGSYSSFESVAMDVPSRNLLKGSVYSEDSGGDPLKIPTLSYDEYLEFHKKWYRPENCFVFLYGNISTSKQLDFIQKNFLDKLEKNYTDTELPLSVKKAIIKNHIKLVSPHKVSEPLFVHAEGPGGEEKQKGNTVYVTWNMGPSKDAFSAMEKIFLTGILLNHDGSPLQKSLIDCELGEDTAPGIGLDALYNTLFTVGLRGVKKTDTQKVVKTVFDTLTDIVKNGINQDDIDSTLMTLNFSHREIRRSRGPYALSIMNAPVNAWLYGYDIEKSFRLRSVLDEVRDNIKSKKGYLEKLIKKYFLDNKNYIVSEISPSKSYSLLREREEKKLLNSILSATSIEKIKKQNEKLKLFQQKKDDTSLLPHLSPKDFLKKGKRVSDSYELKIKTLKSFDNSKIDYFVSSENTNGVTYIDVGYPVDLVNIDDYPYLPLLADTVTDCGWGKLDWSQAASETAIHTGGIGASLLTNDVGITENNEDFIKTYDFTGRDYLIFKLRVLDEELENGLNLLADNINFVDFSDLKRIKDIVFESRNDFDSSIVPAGHQYAMLRSLKTSSRVSAVDEIWNGITQMYALHKISELDPKLISQNFNRILRQIKLSGGFVHITAEEQTIKKSSSLIQEFVNKIKLTKIKPKKEMNLNKLFELVKIEGEKNLSEKEIFVIPGSVGYAGAEFSAIPYGKKGNAILEVISHWLSNNSLWEKIRTIGGAYGAFCDIDSVSGNVLFATYRDPSPQKSIDVFLKGIEEAAKQKFTEDEVEKAVMGTYSQFVVPKTPRSIGNIELLRTLYGITAVDRENKLLELLNCTPKEFENTLKKLSDFSKQCKNHVIIGCDNCTKSGKKIILPL